MIMVQALLVAGVPAAEIRSYPLDERSVYTIRVSLTEPTTCVFPGPLKAVVGANVSTKADENPGVLLSHEQGTEYFSLRALKEGATGALNLVYRGKVYALVFVTAAEPDRAVVFLDQPAAGATLPSAPPDLPALLERAKQHERQPVAGMTSTVASASPRSTTAYRAFTATIEAIVRFEAEDVLVFRVRLENSLGVPVPYDPTGLAIRLGREFFPAALTDASGAIPPKGSSVIHLVIAGAQGGGRANLSVRESFSVIVPQP
jgi:hypothetical protein